MKKGQLTMQDIADKLGISKSTVSRALKNHPDISEKTKKAVMQLAEEWDFQPNSLALSLRHNKSFIIGVIVPEIVHHFFANVIKGIQEVAYQSGYHVMVCLSNESYEHELKDVNALLSSRVDGILASISRETTNYDHFKKVKKKGTPLLFFDRACDEINVNKILSDDFAGAFAATEHLIKQGCKNILHLAGPKTLDISQSRMDGYLEALKKYGLPVQESLIVRCPKSTVDEAKEIITEIIHSGVTFDGMFAHNDMVAIGAMKGISQAGLRIPEDVAVVGFSNWHMSSIIEPSLSTIEQPDYEMGKLAALKLLEEINAKEDEDIQYASEVVDCKLIVRDSSLKK